MKRLKQSIKHDPDNGKWGDCYRTCIAMVMNLDPATVPHFYDPNADCRGLAGARDWLSGWGYGIIQIAYPPDMTWTAILEQTADTAPGCPLISSGMGPRGNNHCVVVIDGKVFCDPFSGEADQNPFTGPAEHDRESYWWLESIVVLPSRFNIPTI